jgi:hypothetical protein
MVKLFSTPFVSLTLKPCVIDSMFQVPWHPEIGAHALPTQHKVDFQHSKFLLLTYWRCLLKVYEDHFQNLERSMSYAFSIVYVCKLGGQNGCAPDPKHRINYARPKNQHKKTWITEMTKLYPLSVSTIYNILRIKTYRFIFLSTTILDKRLFTKKYNGLQLVQHLTAALWPNTKNDSQETNTRLYIPPVRINSSKI